MYSLEFESAAVAVAVAATEIHTEVLSGLGGILNMEIENTGAVITTGFDVQLKDHKNGAWYDFLSDADFDAAVNASMLFATGTGPHELPADTVAHIIIRPWAAYALRILAHVAAGTTNIIVRGTATSVS